MNSEKMVIIDMSDSDEYPMYPSVLNKVGFICPWNLRRDVEISFYIDCHESRLRPILFFCAQEDGIEILSLIADEAFSPKALPEVLFINLRQILGENIEEKLSVACARALQNDLEIKIDYSIPDQCFIVDIKLDSVGYYFQKRITEDDLLPFLVEEF